MRDSGSHIYAVVSTPEQRNGALLVTLLQPNALDTGSLGSLLDSSEQQQQQDEESKIDTEDDYGDTSLRNQPEGGIDVVTVLQTHSRDVEIVDITVSASHLAVLERKNGTLVATAYPLPSNGEPLNFNIDGNRYITAQTLTFLSFFFLNVIRCSIDCSAPRQDLFIWRPELLFRLWQTSWI